MLSGVRTDVSAFAETPDPHRHRVQFCAGDQPLINDVSGYLAAGIANGDGLLVIATPEHNAAFAQALRELSADVDPALHHRQLLFADASQTLKRFLVDGRPDWRKFERTMDALLSEIHPRSELAGMRAYGEMVGLLWKADQFSEAVSLEQMWNRLIGNNGFELFCSYPIDILTGNADMAVLEPLLCAHTEVISAHPNGNLKTALDRAIEEVLGAEAPEVRALLNADQHPGWPAMAEAEAFILNLRSRIPSRADEILARARRYEHTPEIASDRVQ